MSDMGNDIMTGIKAVGKRFEAYFEGEFLGYAYNHRSAEIMLEKRQGIFVDRRTKGISQVPDKSSKFHINERFEFLEKAVMMVADGVQPSVVITGPGGLGKTYTVKKTLVGCGFNDISIEDDFIDVNPSNNFIFIKGFSTAKNLYRSLYNYNGCIIVLDDIDNILKDSVAVNILKACLDSYDKRIVSWGSEPKGDDNLPRTFEFTGQIIFITNLIPEKIDQAIRSRSLLIDVSMTVDEMVDRMAVIVDSPEFLPNYSPRIKLDALMFIDKNKEIAKELSLRSLISVCNIRHEFPNDWKNMASYVICKEE